jgi:hypothetical protein
VQHGRPSGRYDGGIGGQRNVGIKQCDKGRQVAAAGGGKERGRDLPLAGDVGRMIRAGRA